MPNSLALLPPLPISLAHKICLRLAEARKNGEVSFLRPDGKGQVTMEYRNGKPVRIDYVVLSNQHTPDVKYKALRAGIIEQVQTLRNKPETRNIQMADHTNALAL